MQISPAKKQKLKANLGNASFEDLHPKYSAGTPKGGQFMPKGSTDYVNAVAKNTGKSPAQVKASLGSDGGIKPRQPAPQGKRDYKEVLPPDVVKEIQTTARSLGNAYQAQHEAEQAKLNAGKGAKREASKAFTAAKKEVSAKQKAVEAILIKHGASKEQAKTVAEKLIAKKVGQLSNANVKPVEQPSVKPPVSVEKPVAEKVAKQVASAAKPPIVAPVVDKKVDAIAPKGEATKSKAAKKGDFSKGESLTSNIDRHGFDQSEDPAKQKKTFKALDNAASKVSEITGLSIEDSRKAIHAINGFSQTDYREIRDKEKKGKTFTGISSPAFTTEKKYDRIKAINNFLDNAPKYEGIVHRGMSFKDEKTLNKFLKNIQSGEVLDSMSSTTANVEIAKNFANKTPFNVVMNIKNKSGVAIRSLSKYSHEDEVLVPRGTLYKSAKITKTVDKQGNQLYTIDVDEIDPENQKTRRDTRKAAEKSKPEAKPSPAVKSEPQTKPAAIAPKVESTKTVKPSQPDQKFTAKEMPIDQFNKGLDQWTKHIDKLPEKERKATANIEDNYNVVMALKNDYGKPKAANSPIMEKTNHIAVVDSSGLMQSAMYYKHSKKDGVKVEFLATAPWNLQKEHPNKQKGAGAKAIVEAIKKSKELGYDGKVSLQALPNAVPFYKHLGFKTGFKSGSIVYTLSPKAAEELLKKYGA